MQSSNFKWDTAKQYQWEKENQGKPGVPTELECLKREWVGMLPWFDSDIKWLTFKICHSQAGARSNAEKAAVHQLDKEMREMASARSDRRDYIIQLIIYHEVLEAQTEAINTSGRPFPITSEGLKTLEATRLREVVPRPDFIPIPMSEREVRSAMRTATEEKWIPGPDVVDNFKVKSEPGSFRTHTFTTNGDDYHADWEQMKATQVKAQRVSETKETNAPSPSVVLNSRQRANVPEIQAQYLAAQEAGRVELKKDLAEAVLNLGLVEVKEIKDALAAKAFAAGVTVDELIETLDFPKIDRLLVFALTKGGRGGRSTVMNPPTRNATLTSAAVVCDYMHVVGLSGITDRFPLVAPGAAAHPWRSSEYIVDETFIPVVAGRLPENRDARYRVTTNHGFFPKGKYCINVDGLPGQQDAVIVGMAIRCSETARDAIEVDLYKLESLQTKPCFVFVKWGRGCPWPWTLKGAKAVLESVAHTSQAAHVAKHEQENEMAAKHLLQEKESFQRA